MNDRGARKQGVRAAGAGIVADSDPTAEYQETLSKARGLLKAIEITEECNGNVINSRVRRENNDL